MRTKCVAAIITKDTDRYGLDKKLDHYNWDDGYDLLNLFH